MSGIARWSDDDPELSVTNILDAAVKTMKYIPSVSYWEMTLKTIHRGYISPNRNYPMGGSSTSACYRCGEVDANLFHCFWGCPSVSEFWGRIHCFATTHTNCQFALTPSWAITGSLHETEIVVPSKSKRLLFCISAAARKTILQTWIGPVLPSQRLFLEKLTFLLRMDWVEASLQKEFRVKSFFQTWTPIINLLPTHIRQRIKTCF